MSGGDWTTEDLLRRPAGVTVVEALGPPYFRSGHIPGAVNIPPHRVAELASRLLPDRRAPVVVYGASVGSAHADIVVRHLRALGYSDVCRYPEGKQGWVEAGLPLTVAGT
jgi:rhodanese-related sulfurtransferase